MEFDAGANRLIAGLFEVLMERLATNNGLQAAEPSRRTKPCWRRSRPDARR